MDFRSQNNLSLKGKVKIYKIYDDIDEVYTGVELAKVVISRQPPSHILNNTLCNAGMYSIANHLFSRASYCSWISFGAVGTGTTPPQKTDTSLENLISKRAATGSSSGASCYIYTYFPKNDANSNGQTLTEFGLFGDHYEEANATVLYERVLIDPAITKESSFGLMFTTEINLNY